MCSSFAGDRVQPKGVEKWRTFAARLLKFVRRFSAWASAFSWPYASCQSNTAASVRKQLQIEVRRRPAKSMDYLSILIAQSVITMLKRSEMHQKSIVVYNVMGAASLSSCSLTKTTVCSICSTRKSIITNASSTPTPRIMKRPFKWSKPVRQKRIKSSNKETLGKWETEKWCCLPFDLPRSPYIFAGRQECRALMTRSPIYRIPTGSRLREIKLNADQSQDCWAEGKHDHCNYLSAGWQVETEELSSMWFFLLVNQLYIFKCCRKRVSTRFDLKSESITHTPRKTDLVVKDM